MQRRSYGGGPISSGGGGVLTNGAGVGETDPGIEPEPSDIAVGGKFFLNRGRKVYEMKKESRRIGRLDGNVLAVVSDLKIGIGPSNVQPNYVGYYKADIVEMTDYYPFGMQMVKRHYVADAGYRFGFNGKENDDEWNGSGNMLDFGARVFDPRLGRWLSLDPLASKYPSHSDYCYAANNPVFYLDKGGKSVLGFLIKMALEGLGFGSAADLTNTMNSWEVEGDKRKVIAFIAGAAYASSEVNVIDAGKGLILNGFPVKIARAGYNIANGEDPVKTLISEIPFVGRFTEYEAEISQLIASEGDLDEKDWYTIGRLIAKGVQDGVVVGQLAKGIQAYKRAAALEREFGCFIEGTMVKTEKGDIEIQLIQIGDLVWSWEEKSGRVELKEVLSTFRKQTLVTTVIQLGEERLEVTNEHPFWTPNGWFEAGSLRVGDSVLLMAKNWIIISGIHHTNSPRDVFNITVAGFHTYFVGNKGLLVHNTCGRIKSLQGKNINWIKKQKPSGWKTVTTENNQGWIWVDEAGVERLRYMRGNGSNATNSKWSRQSNGYFRWKNSKGEFLDIDGNVVPKATTTIEEYQNKTHIPYEGVN